MASTETQALKIIWENKGKASVVELAKGLKMGTDYARLICRYLVREKTIEFSQGQYMVTDLGKEELKKLGVIKEVIRPLKKKAKAKKKEKKEKKEKKARKEKKAKKAAITQLSNLAPKLAKTLKKKGFQTLEDIATTSVSKLMGASQGLKLKTAAGMINEARAKLKKQGKGYLWETE